MPSDSGVDFCAYQRLSDFSDIDTLRGFVVGARPGDAQVERLRSSRGIDLALHDSYQQLVNAIAGKISVFCLDEPSAQFLLYRANAHHDFRQMFTLYTGQFPPRGAPQDQATLAFAGAARSSGVRSCRRTDVGWAANCAPRQPYAQVIAYLLAALLAGALLAA